MRVTTRAQRRVPVLRVAILASAAMAACGGATPVVEAAPVSSTVEGSASSETLCRFRDAMEMSFYTSPRGFAFVDVTGAIGSAELRRSGQEVTLRTELDNAGWHLRGALDPRRHDALYASEDVGFGEVVTLRAGARVRLDDVSSERLEVRIPEDMRQDAGLEFEFRDGRLVTCDALRVNARSAVAPPRSGALQEIEVGRTPVSATPGGAADVTFVLDERRPVRVLDEQDQHAHIAYHHWTGISVAGWVARGRLVQRPSGLMGMGRGGGSGGFTHCPVVREVAIVAVYGSLREEVGTLAPGTQVRRHGEEGEEVVVHPLHGVGFTPAEGVRLLVPGSALGECVGAGSPRRRRQGILSALGAVQSTQQQPQERLSITARVRRVHGLAGVQSGAACTVELVHQRACRAVIRCGRHTLFGWVPENGFFSCEFDRAAGRVVGEDSHTTSQSSRDGDPTLLLDTDRRVLRMRDDASGQHGAFELQAEIETVR